MCADARRSHRFFIPARHNRHVCVVTHTMKSFAVLAFAFILVTGSLVAAQSRSADSVIQRGGAPNLASLLVGLVPADPIELTGAVDSNTPAVGDLAGGQRIMC